MCYHEQTFQCCHEQPFYHEQPFHHHRWGGSRHTSSPIFFAYHSDILLVTPSSPGFGTTTCLTCTCSSAVVVVAAAFWSLPRPRACAPAVTLQNGQEQDQDGKTCPGSVPAWQGLIAPVWERRRVGQPHDWHNETGTIIVPMPVTDMMCQSESADESGSQTPLRSPHSHTHSGFHPAHTAHTHPD